MSLGLFVLIAGVIFALVVAALPLWDIRHQLWATWDWRDWTRVALPQRLPSCFPLLFL